MQKPEDFDHFLKLYLFIFCLFVMGKTEARLFGGGITHSVCMVYDFRLIPEVFVVYCAVLLRDANER